jgi:hypothetical protein
MNFAGLVAFAVWTSTDFISGDGRPDVENRFSEMVMIAQQGSELTPLPRPFCCEENVFLALTETLQRIGN